MRWMRARGILLALLLWPVMAMAQVTTTTLTDTIYHADGTTAGGLVLVSWPAFTTAAGRSVPGGSTSVTIGAGGLLTVQLAPNQGATPAGTFYTAVYHLDDGTVSREFWSMPASTTAVALSAVRSTVLPASVAVQTASKSYVDDAVAAALAGHPITGDVTYLNRTGDAMTGPLALAGDPTTGSQAANKHYVDTAVAGVGTAVAQKVGIAPTATQTVAQPGGTELQANRINDVQYASQYVNGRGNNGLTNAVGAPDCAGGCQVTVENEYNSTEPINPTLWNSSAKNGTHVEDLRGGGRQDHFYNPVNLFNPGFDAAETLDVTSTRSVSTVHAVTGSQSPASIGLSISQNVPTGGSNQFPATIAGNNGPFFKSNYNALLVGGVYNTPGQHVLTSNSINCYGVGDCLIGSTFINASGGFRDEADEGAHPMDIQIHEDSQVFRGSCSTGCTPGSTTVGIAVSAGNGTQGEGRFLIDTNPAKTISTGVLTGGIAAPPVSTSIGPTANFSGVTFPVSVFLATTQVAPASANSMAPGTVTLPIATRQLPRPFATSTAALPAVTGVACVTDPFAPFSPTNYEMAQYTVVDASHITLALTKVHAAGSTITVGGLCGYGLEQTVDTENGIRQLFPVIGASSATQLYYAGNLTPVVGVSGSTSGFLNATLQIASITRSGQTTTVTTATPLPADLNGLTATIAGVGDASFNGSASVTTTGPNTLTYASTAAAATSSGGTLQVLTGGYVLYPMAEVLSVYNQQTKNVNGQLTLAANLVPWAAGDTVEQPHYFQENVMTDVQFVSQAVPRPITGERAGIYYGDNVGPGLHGWTIGNGAAASNYFGNGGTHAAPDNAFQVAGIWGVDLEAQAGESGVFRVHCNSHGCGNWNSGFDLFQLDSNASFDSINFQPLTSAVTFNLRGTTFGFSPQGFTAGTVNAKQLSVSSDTVAPQVLQFVAPNLGSGSQFCQGFGRNLGPHNSTFYCWWNTAVPYGSLETYAGGDPLQVKGSSVWLNGGPVAIGNAATIGSALPALLNVGANAQFQVDAAGNVKAANFAGVLAGQTGAIGGTALATGACVRGTAAVAGAAVGTPVLVSASDGSLPNGLTTLSAAVTAGGTVTVQVCAVSTVTPTSVSYNVRVVQ